MKKFLLLPLLSVLVLASCTNAEKILPKADGRWENSRVEMKTYLDDSLTSDTAFFNDGFTNFQSDGSGTYEDNSGNITGNFSWSVDDDQLTVTEGTNSLTSTILELNRKSITTFTREEGDLFGATLRAETTLELNRVDN